MSSLYGMKHGDSVSMVASSAQFAEQGPKHEVKVSYHDAQSHGDNGSPVRGATTGRYTVNYPSGRTSYHDHGPHANTEAARKKGANPYAKQYAADNAISEIHRHFATARNFNDRRTR